jgi:hypothetical protein
MGGAETGGEGGVGLDGEQARNLRQLAEKAGDLANAGADLEDMAMEGGAEFLDQ